MDIQESISGLKRTIVISMKEGAQIGYVNKIFMDPKTQKLSALSFRENRLGREHFVGVESIERIGKDVVFVKSEEDVKHTSAKVRPQGRNLRGLKGHWVTTFDGEHVGIFEDFDVNKSDWKIVELRLSNNKAIPMDESVKIGVDEFLVPNSVAKRAHPIAGGLSGLMSRFFGQESRETIVSSVNETVKKMYKSTDSSG